MDHLNLWHINAQCQPPKISLKPLVFPHHYMFPLVQSLDQVNVHNNMTIVKVLTLTTPYMF
jgi:hypothetical protein